MRRLIGLSIPITLLALIEVGILSSIRHINGFAQVGVMYTAIAITGYIVLALAFRYWRISPIKRSPVINFFIGLGFAAVVQKVVLFVSLMAYGVIRLIGSLEYSESILTGILIFSFLPFFAMIYGILWGKYRFVLEDVVLRFGDLPPAFDGFKIVQISDVHSGTWDSIEGVEKGIKMIEAQGADMLVFTGDLVNADKDEIDPFMHLFERLEAPYGKYAVLGNHDYAGQPRDRTLRPAYYSDLFSKFKKMGFDLIMNDHRQIRKDGDVFQLIGVENWGSGRFFPKRGDLDRATSKAENGAFSILLSHDPSHWDLKAAEYPHHFHLTLSGHTHGMQFGVNLPFFKWSPVQYRYKQWMGLYTRNNQYLYVNRGFGLLAFPGRVGMSPEVTLITLRREA